MPNGSVIHDARMFPPDEFVDDCAAMEDVVTVTVTDEFAPGLTDVGFTEHSENRGAPLHEKLTAPEKFPPTAFTLS